MSAPRERLRRVVIAGGGQVGVLAAIALRRALPDAQVVVVGLPVGAAAMADRASTAQPFTNRLHDRLGIAEADLVQRAGASHRLVTRLFGWGAAGQSGAIACGAQQGAEARTRFAREWGGGSRGSGSGSPPPGSLGEALANAGRFAVPPGDVATPLDGVDYALRWNLPAYRDLLIGTAQQLGVSHVAGAITAIRPDGAGGVAAVVVDGQGALQADLFIDCSGPAALLLSALPGAARQDWSDVLPLRQVLLARPGPGMLALEDRFSLLPEGWLGELAGRDGLQVSLGLAPGVGEQAALAALAAEPAELLAIEPGCQVSPWCGNVVALGDAAATFEPLGHFNLDLAHRQLALLLEMLPGRTIEPLERAEFNRRAGLMAADVRDTLALHYSAPRALAVFGNTARPARLERAIDQFTRKGRLPFHEESALLGEERMALLRALGFAQGVSPQSRGAAEAELRADQARFAAQVQAALGFAPPYQQFMLGGTQAAGSPGTLHGELEY